MALEKAPAGSDSQESAKIQRLEATWNLKVSWGMKDLSEIGEPSGKSSTSECSSLEAEQEADDTGGKGGRWR